jgi:hypothetical protein
MAKYVYEFSEGNKDLKDLLGGKGANLAEKYLRKIKWIMPDEESPLDQAPEILARSRNIVNGIFEP